MKFELGNAEEFDTFRLQLERRLDSVRLNESELQRRIVQVAQLNEQLRCAQDQL